MSITRRFALAATIFVLLTPYGRHVLTQAMFEVNFDEGKEGSGLGHNDVLLNLTDTPRVECFYRCSTECYCSAFQVFKETDCQLLSSSRSLTPLQPMPGYTYYDMIPWKAPGTCPMDCCRPNPCLNGGTCESPINTDGVTIRFRCVCRRGHGGKLCQYRVTCNGYADIVAPGDHGLYNLTNLDTGKPFQVYCRFSTHSGRVYGRTLIQSYALQNVSQIRPFAEDAPINEHNVNWIAWRLSKANMKALWKSSDSVSWFVTCDLDKIGWKLRYDILVVELKNFNILEENNAVAKCCEASRLTIRGEGCRYCNVAVTQTMLYPLYVNTDRISIERCLGTVPSISMRGCNEESFGWYQCTNTSHSCAASPQSTTQHWIGV